MTTFTGTIPTIASGDTTTVPTNFATWRDCMKALSEARTSYTPTWTTAGTAPAIGNGSIAGRYRQVTKDVAFSFKLTFGSTTTSGTGVWSFTLPVAPHASEPCVFDVRFIDASTGAVYRGVTYAVSGSTVSIAVDNGTAGGPLQQWTSTVPVAPAVGDVLSLTGVYEAA